jgi:hypothetical protein
MEEEDKQGSYWPFFIVSLLYIPSVTFTNLILFDLFPKEHFYSFMPLLNVALLAGIGVSCHNIRFNPLIIFMLGIEAILVAPSLFLVLQSLFTGNMNIDFFKTMLGKKL